MIGEIAIALVKPAAETPTSPKLYCGAALPGIREDAGMRLSGAMQGLLRGRIHFTQTVPPLNFNALAGRRRTIDYQQLPITSDSPSLGRDTAPRRN